MNKTNRSFGKPGFFLCSALVATLAGCTTYVEESPPPTTYVPPPPAEQAPPPVVYAPPVSPPPQPPMYAPPADASAEVVIRTENDFVEPLSPYGEWVVIGSYGRCWRPLRVEAGWRPYCNGYWQRSDAGWFWVTDEPWGWATYHYGRWDWSVQFGWIWVPQTQWAPSWVAWREGGGYVGWAPLPPTATIAVSGGVVFRDPAFAPRAFVFVEERRLLEPVRSRTVIVNNTTVINKTVNITKIQVINKTVVNDGPRPDVIERVSGRRIQPVAVRDLRHRQEAEVVTRHPALRRDGQPAATTERTVQPPVHPEPESRQGVLPHQTTPVAAKPEFRPQPKPAVLPHETGQAEKPIEAVKEPLETRNRAYQQKPSTTPVRSGAERPTRNEKAPELKTERERPAAVKRPSLQAGDKQAESQLKSDKEKAAKEQAGANVKQKEQKKKGEPSETPQKPVAPPQ